MSSSHDKESWTPSTAPKPPQVSSRVPFRPFRLHKHAWHPPSLWLCCGRKPQGRSPSSRLAGSRMTAPVSSRKRGSPAGRRDSSRIVCAVFARHSSACRGQGGECLPLFHSSRTVLADCWLIGDYADARLDDGQCRGPLHPSQPRSVSGGQGAPRSARAAFTTGAAPARGRQGASAGFLQQIVQGMQPCSTAFDFLAHQVGRICDDDLKGAFQFLWHHQRFIVVVQREVAQHLKMAGKRVLHFSQSCMKQAAAPADIAEAPGMPADMQPTMLVASACHPFRISAFCNSSQNRQLRICTLTNHFAG